MKLFWILVILVVCVLAVDARPDRTRLRELSDKLSGFKNMQGKMKGEKPSSGTQKPDKPDSDSIQSAGFSFSLPNLPVPDIPNIECADQMPIVLQMLSAITGQDRCKDVQCTKRGKITLSAPNYINAYCQCILCGGAKCVQYLAACSNHKCENGGSCIATPGSCTEHTCQCPGCYSGTYCSVLEDGCKLNPCNNGICTPVPGSCTEYTCPQCQECYSGANCETLEDPCENHQCQNGGACVPVPGSCTDYTCQCAGCYSGSECRTCGTQEQQDQTWRDDLRCGSGYPAHNGKDAECNPISTDPCCSEYNWCGNTPDYCECPDCVDYRPKEGAPAWREDKRCGHEYIAPNGQDAECNPISNEPCCSDHNWCGNTPDYCQCQDCIDYRLIQDTSRAIVLAVRGDYRCGPGYPAANGQDAICIPTSDEPCCSEHNWCGNTPNHCICLDCIDYRLVPAVQLVGVSAFREDYRCGSGYPAPNGHDAECNPASEEPCCSVHNWCGNTPDHCTCLDCIDYRLMQVQQRVDVSEFREDYRCGPGFPAPNGEDAKCNATSAEPCCSIHNWCGNTTIHCTCLGCIDYRLAQTDHPVEVSAWREDYRCGQGYPTLNGQDAICNPTSDEPCCSLYGWCGNTIDHCNCTGCIHYKPEPPVNEGYLPWPPQSEVVFEAEVPGDNNVAVDINHNSGGGFGISINWPRREIQSGQELSWRKDGLCGPGFPAPNGRAALCNPSHELSCCGNVCLPGTDNNPECGSALLPENFP